MIINFKSMFFSRFKLNVNALLYIAGLFVLILAAIFFFWWNKEIIILGKGNIVEDTKNPASLTGLECENFERRPVAVMMASDPEARPLSGISQADLVIEMPVTPDGITRIMAVFQCDDPEEIGSIRSAREDFIPLAAGFKALYVHWGGEREALQKLDNGIVDNIDALKYDGTFFYRKSDARPPHNGFTNLDLISEISKKKEYNLKDTFSGFVRENESPQKTISNIAESVSILYAKGFNIDWVYDNLSGVYLRSRDGSPEIDKNNSRQVGSEVIIVMKTKSEFISDEYISVDVESGGEAIIYQRAVSVGGSWKKDPQDLESNLTFIGPDGREIALVPGKIWIEIIVE